MQPLVLIPTQVMQDVVQYLVHQPFKDVAPLIGAIEAQGREFDPADLKPKEVEGENNDNNT